MPKYIHYLQNNTTPMNFFTDTPGLQYHFDSMDIDAAIWVRESLQEGDYLGEIKATYRQKLEALGKVCAEVFAPRAKKIDQLTFSLAGNRLQFPQELQENLELLNRMGLNGVTLPLRYNGLNFPVTIYVMMMEMIARADASLHNHFGLQCIADTLLEFGTPQQKWQWLPAIASGKVKLSMVLTEPEAGSDLQAIQTKAIQLTDESWRLTGIKHLITNGQTELLLVLARSEEKSKDGRGLSLFLVSAQDTPVKLLRLISKLGLHGVPTCTLQFQETPAELLGQRRRGLIQYLPPLLSSARLSIGAQAVGLMEAIRSAARDYCRQRRQFEKKLEEIPQINILLTRMDVLTEGCRAMLYETAKWADLRAAWLQASQNDPDNPRLQANIREFGRLQDALSPFLKYIAAEAANRVAYDGIQVLGGRGLTTDYPMERYFRDARALTVYEGTSQIQINAALSILQKGHLAVVMASLLGRTCPEDNRKFKEALAQLYRQLEEALQQCTSKEMAAPHLIHGYGLLFIGLVLAKQPDIHLLQAFCQEFIPSIRLDIQQSLQLYKN